MKYLIASVVGCLLINAGWAGAQQTDTAKASALKNRADSVAYAFGASIGRDLKRTGLDEINATVLAQAIAEVFAGKAPAFGEAEERELIMNTITAAKEQQDARLKAEATAFMEGNKARSGVVATASGLQYEVIREGTGEKPALDDTVTVHYKGQLSDGRVFDSSYDRGEPATFPLDRVIPGWQEGLQLMPAGAHYRIYIPYELGYGERGAGQDIPPYSSLVFEVELISVKKATKDIPAVETSAEQTE
ncbi:FKBP-type peptidyl-prolyl cis-trans isomerase [Parapedobacter sp. DT-150]|uniref:FKBP-type peptidyl-prolyl cis-trans isomerase n=1 Tax=Parapedobacter sp. DT-150 TaxID=3396162 RepID=UPI003F19EF98